MTASNRDHRFQTIAYRFTTIFWKGIDWIFPPVCAGCGNAPQRFCVSCKQNTPKPQSRVCVLCGEALARSPLTHSCDRINGVDRALVWGLHSGPVRKAIHQFKYRRDLGLADTFAGLMAEIFLRSGESIDVVVAVPLARERYKERGFNQAALLAYAISGQCGITYIPAAASRDRETRPQVGLNIEQRRSNVDGAFSANPLYVSGKNILLIDDVLTTGATLNACATALKEAGAQRVVALTLARAP